ncbi:MAG: amino acid permease [Thermodesulfobacteriota bacterium]|nr:amino acid permease [Thermodesulfobacteriota bacterium]
MSNGLTSTSSFHSRKGSLGTFPGVFTPSILTILGIILFLRLGYVVGQAGLGRTLVIIGLSNAISVLTSFSLAAIATNLKVKGGGDYYLISRTLGVEFGGAIGIVLFMAQSVSIAFYCIGFGEAFAGMLNNSMAVSSRLIGLFAVAFLFIFAWLGSNWATRFQYVVMTLLTAALVSFFWGGLPRWGTEILFQNWSSFPGGTSFWLLFAIFFPAVTGFTQGVSMSGDLKDPGKSLPLGTFYAVGISIIVYFGVAMVFAGVLPLETLSSDYASMKRVARYGLLIDAGVVAATLSSAMASFLGAPRILQSLAGDRIFKFLAPFSMGSGPDNNPRRGVLLSTGIAFATIALGNLNDIASVVSMFFLISYGLLNYATFFEARTASPSFRPRFRWFDYRLSLLGFLVCLGAMMAINPVSGIVAISILFAIYQFLRRTAGQARWADSRRSYHLQQVREHLISAAEEEEHSRDWRPQILAFTDDKSRRQPLLKFAHWIQGGSGTTTAVQVVEGEGIKVLREREKVEEALRRDIKEKRLPAFPLAISMPDFSRGGYTLLQSFGIGPLKANIVLLNWFDYCLKGVPGLHEFTYARNLRMAFRLGCNIIVLDAKEEVWSKLEGTQPEERLIDVWWLNDESSNLILLLAHLMTRDEEWSEAKIRVLAPGNENAEEHLQNALDEARIGAEPVIVKNATIEMMIQLSSKTSLVFLPFRLSGNQIIGPFESRLEEILQWLPVVALVLVAEDVDLIAEPEEGKAGEMALALDALAAAQGKARKSKKEALEAAEALEKAEEKVNELMASAGPGADRETMNRIDQMIHKATVAREDAEKAMRRATKIKAKAELAAKAVEDLGAQVDRGQDQYEGKSGPEKNHDPKKI